MSNKMLSVRDCVLDRVESGTYEAGERLPSARNLAAELGVSLPIVQQSFVSLTRDGILRCIPRQGMFVRHDWRERLLPGGIKPFRGIFTDLIRDIVSKKIPALRICGSFHEAMYEINATVFAQQKQSEFLDLREFVHELNIGSEEFFMAPFRSFTTGSGKLLGIPLIFSPWVVCYNRNLFDEVGIAPPKSNWQMGEMIELVRRLGEKDRERALINFDLMPSLWMNFVYRAGGALIEQNGKTLTVKLDSPESIAGLKMAQQLFQAIRGRVVKSGEFRKGNQFLQIAPREELVGVTEFEWGCVPLPQIAGGKDLAAQSANLLCVRRQVNDFDQVREVIRQFLSPEVQSRLAEAKYGIPIRKTAAIRSFDEDDPRDRVFLSEMSKCTGTYNFDSKVVYNLVSAGVNRIWQENAAPEAVTAEISTALRCLIRYGSDKQL